MKLKNNLKNRTQYEIYKFCPKCSGNLTQEALQVCQNCGFKFFQNSKPTVGAIVYDSSNRVLLAKRTIREAPGFGKWDIPGGFLENGEGPVMGIKREVMEEIKAKVKIKKLFGVYTDKYTFKDKTNFTFNIVYICVLLTEPKPSEEFSELKWFSKSEIPWEDIAFENVKLSLRDYFDFGV
ncbi:MAG: NUDIX domain-containing protein [bacterium]